MPNAVSAWAVGAAGSVIHLVTSSANRRTGLIRSGKPRSACGRQHGVCAIWMYYAGVADIDFLRILNEELASDLQT
jgi:hypothetical protein